MRRVLSSRVRPASVVLVTVLVLAVTLLPGVPPTAPGSPAGPVVAEAAPEIPPHRMTRARVYVNDRTPRGWEVRRASAAWDAAPHVRVVYGHRCRDGWPCVRVVPGPLPSDVGGRTYRVAMRGDRYYRMRVVLPRKRFGRWSDRIQEHAVTHELGHALGLHHDTRRGSVMFPELDGKPRTATRYDRRLLGRAYA